MTKSEFRKGFLTFQKHEKRDAIYKTASLVIKNYWNKPTEVANGLGVLLLIWNNAFYRYGLFDFKALEKFLVRNKKLIKQFRSRNILSYKTKDNADINRLYNQLLNALKIVSGKKAGQRSPVGVAKALHLLAPAFFPLWDARIAKAYNCHYNYIPFMEKMHQMSLELTHYRYNNKDGKSLLKLIDEYNYAKYTQGWV